MRMCGEELNEYKLLRNSSVRDFLNKFAIFVEGIERDRKK